MSKVLEGLRYSDDHEWVKVEGNVAVVGISDFAQHELGDITYADLPEVDDEVVAGEEFGALESVIEVNAELDDAPEKINEDAYEAWIIKVEMTDPAEVDALMDAAAYQEFTEK